MKDGIDFDKLNAGANNIAHLLMLLNSLFPDKANKLLAEQYHKAMDEIDAGMMRLYLIGGAHDMAGLPTPNYAKIICTELGKARNRLYSELAKK